MFSVTIQIKSEVPIHRQIADQIEAALAAGQLRADRNLPSVRGLAGRLSVSPATVVAAYRELGARRVVESRPRSGYRAVVNAAANAAAKTAAGAEERDLGRATRIDGVPYPLHRIEPNLRLHPVAEFGRLIAEEAAACPASGGYEDYRGYGPLRVALEELLAGDGVEAPAERGILVTDGAQHAISLAARVLGASGRVAMEDPVYPGARLAFSAAGAEVLPLTTTGDGPDPAALDALAAKGPVDLLYCCPTYGNPSGHSWSDETRERVLAVAARRGILVFEDDYLGDLEYRGPRRPPLAAMAGPLGARVVHVRTFSKCLLPALRLAVVAAETRILERLLSTRTVDNICGSALLQRPLARFLAEGRYRSHLERVRPHYRELREAVAAQAARCPGGLSFDDPPGGLCLLGTLPRGIDAEGFAEACRAEGVLVTPGASYWARETDGEGRFRIGFGSLEIEDAERAFAALGRALERAERRKSDAYFRRALL